MKKFNKELRKTLKELDEFEEKSKKANLIVGCAEHKNELPLAKCEKCGSTNLKDTGSYMNFKEWYKKFWGGCTSTHQEVASNTAWDACKNEIIKILERNKIYFTDRNTDSYDEQQAISLDVLDKIKKL